MQQQHTFWKTQPVPQQSEINLGANRLSFWNAPPTPESDNQENGPIVKFEPEQIKTEPLELPNGYEWFEFDVNSDDEIGHVHKFLLEHYAADPNNFLRLSYPIDTLRWALCPPNYKKEWHIGVRHSATGQLAGLITAVPSVMMSYGKKIDIVEINFLCVRSNFREKGLAPVLIREISRRVIIRKIWYAVYTSALVLPHSVSEVRYFHRPLNIRKLVQIGFWPQHPKLTMKGMMQMFNLPALLTTKGIRGITNDDVRDACNLLNATLAEYPITTEFTEDEFRHHFLPRNEIVYSYVVDNEGIKAFFSFYSLPSVVIQSGKEIKTAYLYYNTISNDSEIIKDVLILAKQLGFDVFNSLNTMGFTQEISQRLKFSPSNGVLRYYLYNWRCPLTPSDKIGLKFV
jgi:glycylpeptide N-tetradecanoyltransferase